MGPNAAINKTWGRQALYKLGTTRNVFHLFYSWNSVQVAGNWAQKTNIIIVNNENLLQLPFIPKIITLDKNDNKNTITFNYGHKI